MNSGESKVLTSLNIDEFEAVVFDFDSTLIDTHLYPLVASEWLLENSNVNSDEEREAYPILSRLLWVIVWRISDTMQILFL